MNGRIRRRVLAPLAAVALATGGLLGLSTTAAHAAAALTINDLVRNDSGTLGARLTYTCNANGAEYYNLSWSYDKNDGWVGGGTNDVTCDGVTRTTFVPVSEGDDFGDSSAEVTASLSAAGGPNRGEMTRARGMFTVPEAR